MATGRRFWIEPWTLVVSRHQYHSHSDLNKLFDTSLCGTFFILFDG